MIVKPLPSGAERMTYLVGHPSTREAILIDPGDQIAAYLAEAERLGLRIRHAFAADYGERVPFGLLELREHPDVRIHQSDSAPFLHDAALLRPEVPVTVGALRIFLVRDALGAESFAVHDLEQGRPPWHSPQGPGRPGARPRAARPDSA